MCLKINMKKTQYLVINRNGKQPKCNLHFGDNIVKQTNEYCYLGVMITGCGSFSSAMKMLYKKGLKAMFCLLNNVNKTKQLPDQSSDILQHSQNRPTGDRWLKF